MKSRTWMVLAIALPVAAVAWLTGYSLSISATPAQAQQAPAPLPATEYGLILGVPSVESYDIDLDQWADDKNKLKPVVKKNVFVYHVTGHDHHDRGSYLAKLNQLGNEGWRVLDAKAGLLERRNR